MPIARNDQAAEFFFVNPQKFAPLAAALNVLIASDLNEPRRLHAEYVDYAKSELLSDDGDDAEEDEEPEAEAE